MSEVKYMDIKEFSEKGYLFELNRQFLHPLGLALEVKIDDDGNEFLGGIWDCRDKPEGIYYGDDLIKSKEAIDKYKFIDNEFRTRAQKRYEILGYVYQPVLENDHETMVLFRKGECVNG